jgi:alpha-L-arabinofuranosidase
MNLLRTMLANRFSKSSLVLFCMGVALAGATSSLAQTTPTSIQVTSAVQQASVNRLGINLADQTYYDSGQMMKNLVFQNPGFEAGKYRSIMTCVAVTSNTCTDSNQWSPQPTGFWKGGTYSVISGKSAGTGGSVVASTIATGSIGQVVQFDQSLSLVAGDYVVVTNSFPGNGDLGWWDSVSGGGTISSETTDLSPETPGKQALVLSAATAGSSAAITQYFDNEDSVSFIQLNGTFAVTFRAKGIGGNNQLNVTLQRLDPTGTLTYLNKTVTLTNAWADYTLPLTADETGTASGTVQLIFAASGASVELDDASLAQTNSSSSNPTVFRDDVVNALKELNPGTIRMMASYAALGSDIPNQLQVPLARYREGYSTNSTSVNDIVYGIHEFLQLCQTVGADPWITIPAATTPAEMTDFVEYLTGTGSDPWSALRISRGQTAPWTSVFNKVHIELGNETWNGVFEGETITYTAYPEWANQVFGAARATSGYQAAKFDLILNGFTVNPWYNQQLLAASTKHDSFDIGPYLLYSANNEAQATMFGALFAEPEMFDSASGEVGQNLSLAAAAPTPTYINVYETNLSPITGDITQAQLNALAPSVGAGIAHADHMLQMMRMGVQYQNAFALPQWEYGRSDGSVVKLWGTVVDMGKTNRRRPQFLTEAMANSVIGGNMLQTAQTGANPTWNQPMSSDNVQLNGAHYLQSFAFQNGSSVSVILFNLNQTTALPVTFTGANAPSGTVEMTRITSANITDNNETSTVVEPTTQTLSSFNPATGISLPPFSMTVLTVVGNAVQAPAFSVAAGTYTAAQTVTITDATTGAAIYYTTDGSTPTTSSTKYTGAVTVSGSETLQAIATVTGLTPSAVTSAAYVISSPTTATPTFSVAGGSYTSAQTVTIADATAGASIYYTTNGTTPTTASTKYTGAVKVSASETIEAIATATNYKNSATATAAYSITAGTTAAAMPTFSVAAGTYSSAQTVTISDATAGASIYYTTNGTTPTTASTLYKGAITVSSSETLEAIAVAPSSSTAAVSKAAVTTAATTTAASPVAKAVYVITTTTAATPVFGVMAGTYAPGQTVTITDATSGAAIYYTTNGATPTTASTKYAGAIKLSASETIKAIAVATNASASAVATAAYVVATPVATPVFSVASGSYASTQTVAITDATAKSTIYYTTDGVGATTGWTKYTGPITVSSSKTVSAIASAVSYSVSAKATVNYTITAAAAKTAALSK